MARCCIRYVIPLLLALAGVGHWVLDTRVPVRRPVWCMVRRNPKVPGELRVVYQTQPAPVALSADGRLLACATQAPPETSRLRGNEGGYRVSVCDLEAGRVLWSSEPLYHYVQWLACSPDGQHLLAAGGFPQGWALGLRVWNLRTGRLEAAPPVPIGSDGGLPRLALSPDGRFLATFLRAHVGNEELGRVLVYDTRSWALVREIRADLAYGIGIAFSPDGSLLAVSGSNRGAGIRLWETLSGRPRGRCALQGDVAPPVFTARGATLICGTTPLDLRHGVRVGPAIVPDWGLHLIGLVWPDERLAVFDWDLSEIRVWDLAAQRQVLRRPGCGISLAQRVPRVAFPDVRNTVVVLSLK